MASRVLVLACTIAVVAAVAAVQISEDEHKTAFSKFSHKFGRNYTTSHDLTHRFGVFKKMHQRVNDHNARFAAGEVTWDMQIDQFSDWTAEEFKNYFSGYVAPNGTTSQEIADQRNKRQPAWIDWSQKGAVGPVKSQGGCGSCWAFAAVATLEGCHMMANKGYTSLSEQQLQDCLFSRVCSPGGGGPDQAIDWAHNHGGISSSGAYPWTESNGNCHDADIAATTGGRLSAFGHNDIVNLVARGPAAIGIVGSTALQGYHSGVLNDGGCGDQTNHAVLAVGYAQNCQNSGLDCWIIKNSWGTGWGTGGYALIAKGRNMCGIEHDAHLAVNC